MCIKSGWSNLTTFYIANNLVININVFYVIKFTKKGKVKNL